MSCYYPLLGLPHAIDASITLFSHTHNQRVTDNQCLPSLHQREVALYAPKNGQWVLRDKPTLPLNGDLQIYASTYGLAPGELIVAVPLSTGTPIEDRTDILPIPSSKRVDQSPIAERGCLAFHWRGVTSSYQGEYPLRMADVEGGSFLSFDPLLKSDPSAGGCLVVLISIKRRHDPSSHSLELFDGRSKKLLASIQHHQNSCTILEVPAEGLSEGPLVMRGSGWVGIPIVIRLSRLDAPASMSVEHTHPPTELFWDQDRFAGSRKIKSAWMGMKASSTKT
jgi:hypothetical protein